MRKSRILCAQLLCLLLLLNAVSGCSSDSGPQEQRNEAQAAAFANYQAVPVDFSPSVKPYRVEPGLGNVTNRDMFQLSSEAERLLAQNGFVVVPNQYHREFFMLYEINSYEPVPSFITTDSMLHNYHLFFNHLLRVTEKQKLAAELKKLTAAMLLASEKQYTDLKGGDWENAALRNIAFFAVAGKLLDPQMVIPQTQQIEQVVQAELQLIEKSAGIQESPLMNMGQHIKSPETLQEDYSQYIPRGHYAADRLLESYFKAMMWYGRMTFRLKSEDETKSAVLITQALGNDGNETSWDKIYQPTTFFVGKADDLSYRQYRELLDKTYGAGANLKEVVSGGKQWQSFMTAAAKLQPPSINSIPIYDQDIQPNRERAITGFRFMGQRFTLDAAIFQRLVYREVGENAQGEQRLLPRGLDIPAAMGSAEAYAILESAGETQYTGYPENMHKLQQYLTGLEQATWTQNLYWSWLYTLEPLLQEREAGYPSFMQSQAWTRKELTTWLAGWTELKHDTILYAKQVYAEMGGGMAGVDDRGYVEPNPHLYARLAALVNLTREGLAARGLLNQQDRDSLDRLEQLALSLKTISEKELNNVLLTDQEYDLIRSYGGQLEHFWLEALKDTGVDHRSAIQENPAALVADVATDPNGRVLEEGTGHVFEIYAVVPVADSLRIARGGVYSHYEFAWPLEDRLTDQKWHAMLDAGQVPPLAEWTKTYIAP